VGAPRCRCADDPFVRGLDAFGGELISQFWLVTRLAGR
jgi:hypothetical protein